MININGNKFAKNEKELIDTLFNSRQTAMGTYKKKNGGAMFFNLKKEPWFFLTKDKFFVSCTRHEGKIWYMYALDSLDERKLGLKSYSDEIKTANRIHKEIYS